MKKYLFAAAFAAALCAPCARASGTQSGGVRVGPAAEEKVAGDSAAKAEPKKDEKKPSAARDSSTRDAKSAQPNSRSGEAASAVTPAPSSAAPSTSDAPAKPGAPAPVNANTPARPASDNRSHDGKSPASNDNKPSGTNGGTPAVSAPAVSAPAAAPLTTVYRIGVGDVLDIRTLNDTSTRQSTLFTVGAGGVLDHPYLRDPLTIAGMTTDELAAQLVAEFRHRGIYEKPQVRVSVREYASHAVLVSGLAGDPGTKILRREAIPLYVVIAEAQPKPEAGRAIIISHSTGKVTSVDLNDAAALNTLVQAGDVINLTV
ncbi:MAG TPA: polysaccharide biosynthesis/export family protein, partial [Pyrinomonadaceae bacterium]|nr:polysaccharide biosynthesis/export family protein [Pyrinomonadaceae bacterium]